MSPEARAAARVDALLAGLGVVVSSPEGERPLVRTAAEPSLTVAPAPGSAPSPTDAGSSSDGVSDPDDVDPEFDPDVDPDAPAPTDLLAVACGVGLLTGLGVGAFNIAEHGVHDLVFLTTTAYSPDRFQVEGMRDVRPETWVQAVGAVAAPTAAIEGNTTSQKPFLTQSTHAQPLIPLQVHAWCAGEIWTPP